MILCRWMDDDTRVCGCINLGLGIWVPKKWSTKTSPVYSRVKSCGLIHGGNDSHSIMIVHCISFYMYTTKLYQFLTPPP